MGPRATSMIAVTTARSCERRDNAQHVSRVTPEFVSKSPRDTYRVGALSRAPMCRDNVTVSRDMSRQVRRGPSWLLSRALGRLSPALQHSPPARFAHSLKGAGFSARVGGGGSLGPSFTDAHKESSADIANQVGPACLRTPIKGHANLVTARVSCSLIKGSRRSSAEATAEARALRDMLPAALSSDLPDLLEPTPRPAGLVTGDVIAAQEIESLALGPASGGGGASVETGGGMQHLSPWVRAPRQDKGARPVALRRPDAVWSRSAPDTSGGVACSEIAATTKRRPKFHSGGIKKGPTPHA